MLNGLWHCFAGTLPDVPLSTNLSNIGLGHMKISGTIPTSVDDVLFPQVQMLQVSTGLWYVSVSCFRLFQDMFLSGTIRSAVSSSHATLRLYAQGGTSVSGTIPSSVAMLSQLSYYGMWDTKCSGTTPDLSALSSLSVYGTARSQISGTLANWMQKANDLNQLLLHSQRLSGTVPNYFSNLTNIETLLLHGNSFEGTLPPLDKLHKLINLTLFNDGLSGRVVLSSLAQMKILLIHRNRFSCQLEAAEIDIPSADKVMLLLPGADSLPHQTLECLDRRKCLHNSCAQLQNEASGFPLL